MNLYHIQQEHLNLLAQIEEAEGELSPHMEQALGFTLDAFEAKAVSVGFLTKHIADGITAIDAEMKRLKAMKDAAERKQEWFEAQISAAMQQFGIDKIDTPTLKIGFRKSEAVEIDNCELVPAVYMIEKVTEAPDKKAIKDAIKAGKEVPGASLVTRQNLQIK